MVAHSISKTLLLRTGWLYIYRSDCESCGCETVQSDGIDELMQRNAGVRSLNLEFNAQAQRSADVNAEACE